MAKKGKKRFSMATVVIILMLLSFISGVFLTQILLQSNNTIPATVIDVDVDGDENQDGESGDNTDNSEGDGSNKAQGNGNGSSSVGVSDGIADFNVFHNDEDNQRIVWKKQTQIPLFKTQYDNESGSVTVKSAYGDNVIAPGTKNSYDFFVQNTDDSGVEFQVKTTALLEYVVDGVEYTVPIEVRYSNDRGHYYLGTENKYVPISELDGISFRDSLSANCYAKYTFDWQWPFEGDDQYDTLLGNMASADDALSVSLKIEITAVENADVEGGIPNTSYDRDIGIWIAVSICLVITIIMLPFVFKKEKEEYEEA